MVVDRSLLLKKFCPRTGFHPSWSSLCCLGICSGTNLPRVVWLLHFMLQMYAIQQKTSIINNNHPTKNNTMVEPVAGLAAQL